MRLELNKTLLAISSAQQETAAAGNVDWNKVVNGLLTVAGVGIKVATLL